MSDRTLTAGAPAQSNPVEAAFRTHTARKFATSREMPTHASPPPPLPCIPHGSSRLRQRDRRLVRLELTVDSVTYPECPEGTAHLPIINAARPRSRGPGGKGASLLFRARHRGILPAIARPAVKPLPDQLIKAMAHLGAMHSTADSSRTFLAAAMVPDHVSVLRPNPYHHNCGWGRPPSGITETSASSRSSFSQLFAWRRNADRRDHPGPALRRSLLSVSGRPTATYLGRRSP